MLACMLFSREADRLGTTADATDQLTCVCTHSSSITLTAEAPKPATAVPALQPCSASMALWHSHFSLAAQVEPWGSWRIQASNEQYRAEVEATCSQPGSMLRAPTPSNGLQPACRDSFFGQVRACVSCASSAHVHAEPGCQAPLWQC